MSEEKKNDFELHVYDKLWENVIHKENRLWTFLALYGVAISLTMGSKANGALGIAGAYLALMLSYWVSHIVVDSEWWSVRNRAMVRGIERKNPSQCSGIVPSFYHFIDYSSESINSVSVLIFSAIGVLVFFTVVHRANGPELLTLGVSRYSAIVLAAFLLYCGALHIVHVREKKIDTYFVIVEDLTRGEALTSDEESDMLRQISSAKKEEACRMRWRLALAAFIATVSIILDDAIACSSPRSIFISLLVLQSLMTVSILFQYGVRYVSGDVGLYGIRMLVKKEGAKEPSTHWRTVYGVFSFLILLSLCVLGGSLLVAFYRNF